MPSDNGSHSVEGKAKSSGEDKSTEKRRAIQSIMRDNALTDLERRLRIQNLMDGSSNANISAQRSGSGVMVSTLLGSGTGDSSSVPVGSTVPSSSGREVVSCVHYERKCNVIAPCCGAEYGCRVCHDDERSSICGPMDRFAVKEIVCKECKTRQSSA